MRSLNGNISSILLISLICFLMLTLSNGKGQASELPMCIDAAIKSETLQADLTALDEGNLDPSAFNKRYQDDPVARGLARFQEEIPLLWKDHATPSAQIDFDRSGIINFVLLDEFKSLLLEERAPSALYARYRREGYFHCIASKSGFAVEATNALVDRKNAPESKSARITALRYRARIDDQKINRYFGALQALDKHGETFENEVAYWREEANICNAGVEKDDCMEAIVNFIIHDQTNFKSTIASIVCTANILVGHQIEMVELC